MFDRIRPAIDDFQIILGGLARSSEARQVARADFSGAPDRDPGCEAVIEAGIAWLGRAQDCSPSADGGVARHYSVVDGWGTSYPETTGYIVPTMLDFADWRDDAAVRERGRRMLDWLVAIQFPEGGFMGGRIDAKKRVPVTFNTGQILLGLADGVRVFGDTYRPAMDKAAQWLVDSLDADGCWRRHPTPFAEPGEKAYETHVAWGLFEAARMAPSEAYAEAALRNNRWSLTKQQPNGWIADCCLSEPARPLTHTLGYALRGYLEAHRYCGDADILAGARKTADGLLGALRDDGFLPGRLRPDWSPAVNWACLTGAVQIAHCWMMLFETTGNERYRDAGYRANAFVRRTIAVDGPEDRRGGVRGSFPVYGAYGRYEYLNWAAKFMIDANRLEGRLRGLWA